MGADGRYGEAAMPAVPIFLRVAGREPPSAAAPTASAWAPAGRAPTHRHDGRETLFTNKISPSPAGLPDLLKVRREAVEARWRGEMAARHT
jgi:hypothetical protein